jgi:hypothetical protein
VPTRRRVLQSAAVLSAAPLAPKVVFADATGPAAHLAAFIDQRHQASRIFRLRASQWEAPVLETPDGDITSVWQETLSDLWRRKPAAMAGLTERPALFMLEQLGWQHGMRVIFHAEHEQIGQGGWDHRVLRSSSRSLQGHLDAAGAAWPAVLADQLLTAPQAVASKDTTPSGAAMAAHMTEPERLYSWIIAPKSVAAHI